MRPTTSAAANHRAPSGPAVISFGYLPGGSGYSVSAPSVPRRTTAGGFSTVYQSAPSGPAVIPSGLMYPTCSGKFCWTPAGVMRTTTLAEYSVNQRLPSLPSAIALGPSAVVRDSSTVASGVTAGMRPMILPALSAIQSAPSGPLVRWVGLAVGDAMVLVRIAPLSSIRPTSEGFWLTNHIAPSLPAVMSYANDNAGTGDCTVIVPSVRMRSMKCAYGSVNQSSPSGLGAMEYGCDDGSSGLCDGNVVTVGVSAAGAGAAAARIARTDTTTARARARTAQP